MTASIHYLPGPHDELMGDVAQLRAFAENVAELGRQAARAISRGDLRQAETFLLAAQAESWNQLNVSFKATQEAQR